MRRNFNGRGKGGGGFKQKGDDEENGVYVPKKFYLARDKLASYPDEDGCPFYLGDAEDEKSFFAPGFLLGTRSSRNEEYFHRPGMALSLGAASMHRACRTMKDRLLPCWALKGADEPVERILDFEAKFKKTGLSGLVDLLATSDGERFLEALETLDVGREGRRDQPRVEKAVRDLVDVLGEHGQELRKNASRAASFAAKVYLGSMSIMEHLELLEHRKDWAKNMEDAAKSNRHIKAWTKNPKSGDLLVDALTACFMEKIKRHGKGKNQRKQAADTSSEEGDNEDSAKSEADSEHDSPRQREEKRNRAKKRPAKDSSSEDSDVAKPLRKHRGRDQVKAKDGKRQRSSGGGTSGRRTERSPERKPETSRTPRREGTPQPTIDLGKWNVDEVNSFINEANKLVSHKEFGRVEARNCIRLLARLPEDVRKTYGLEYKDAAVLERNAARAVKSIDKCVTDVLAAYKNSFVRSPPQDTTIALEFSDVEEDNPAEALALVSYTNEQATLLTSTIEHARMNMDNKAEALKIQSLLEVLQQVPPYFLEKHNLAQVKSELSTRQRLPRKEHLKTLYERILDMGKSIVELHAAQSPASHGQAEKATECKVLRDVYHTWPREQVHGALAEVTTARANLAESPQHIYPMEHLVTLMDKVPQEIFSTQLALGENWVAAKASGDSVTRDAATTIMNNLIDLMTAVDDHHEQQHLASAASKPSEKEPPQKQAS